MISKEQLLTIVSDLKDEFYSKNADTFCSRLEEKQLNLNSRLAQVVIGVRRSGKSTIIEKVLLQSGLHCAYVNFDDERLYDIKAAELNTLLEAIYIAYGEFDCLFLDEVQNVEGWPLFVNRLLRQGIHLFVTGSNSKLLSGELATHLTGRHNQIELYPFSFSEYCAYRQIDTTSYSTKASALRQKALYEYLSDGGFPELFNEPNKQGYVKGLLDAIINNDVAKRFRIRNVEVLRNIATFLADNIAQEFKPTVIGELFGVSSHTAENYFQHLKDAFLFIGIHKFSYKSKERIRNEKVYAVDTALAKFRSDNIAMANLGWHLENVVFIELCRRLRPQHCDVFYYRDQSFEIDFVVAQNGVVKQLIQVSYDISAPKTLQRELNALIKGSKKFSCHDLLLINMSVENEQHIESETIRLVPAVKWLLGR